MNSPNLPKKRKIQDECRVFNKKWTERYFFIDYGVKALCLICHKTVAVFKEYNLKRHFQTNHANFGHDLSKQELQKRAANLVKSLKQQQSVVEFKRSTTKASFVLINSIAKQNKSFAEAEFIKDCMVDAVGVVCPEIKSKVEAISLSRRTIVRCIGEIAVNIQEQMLSAIGSFQWFSLALDESTGIQNTAQLLIYIRGIDERFEITEELLSVESVKDTNSTGKDLYNSIINSLSRPGLRLDKLASITTDGAPALTVKHSDLVSLMNDKIKVDFPFHSVLSFHCIIHQESLCNPSLKLKHVVDPVVHAVNLIRAQGLKHRQFQSFLEDIEAAFTDVLYHTDAHWLSMGKVLKRVWDLKAEIVSFFNMKGISCDFSKEMASDEWVCDFAFAVDIMQKLNELNTKLHGKGVFAHELYLEVKAFQLKLILFAKQLNKQNFVHFPLLKTQAVTEALANKYSSQLMALKDEFIRRYAGFKAIEGQFDLLSSPFACDIETATEELQMELIDLQADNFLKRRFESKPLVEFYASLHSEKFQNLKKFARKMFVLFASTYICEQTFSVMKVNKSKNSSLLTDSDLQSVLRISTSNRTPDFNKLVNGEDSPTEAVETEDVWIDSDDAKKEEQNVVPKRKRGRPRKSEKQKQKINESKAHPSKEQNDHAEVYVDMAEDPESYLKERWSSGDSETSSRVCDEIEKLKEEDDKHFVAEEWDLVYVDRIKKELDQPETVTANVEVKCEVDSEEIVQVEEEKK